MSVVAVQAEAMLDPVTGDTTRGGVTVLIEDGRITKRGPRKQVAAPRDATTIDAQGLTLLPGLIDCHVHLGSRGTGLNHGERLATPSSLDILTCVESCRNTLAAGFTTVRDAGGTPQGVRMAVERGFFPGPRMVLAIQILSQTGGHADSHFPCGASVPLMNVPEIPDSVVDGVEPMRKRVRQLIRAGADWIKLCTSGGVISPGDAPHHATFTLEEIRAAVEEAATQGRQVMAHAQANAGIKNALIGGVKTIEHGIWLDDDAIEMMQPHEGGPSWGPAFQAGPPLSLQAQWGMDRRLVPTLVAPQWVIRHAEKGRMPAYAAEKARPVIEDHSESIRKAIEARVKIAFGTDSGVGPHGSNAEEFQLLHRLGMEPLDCIRSATLVAADTIGLGGRAGCLDEGAFGDLVGVAGDPLEDLDQLVKAENVRLVVKGGEAVKAA